MARKTTKKSEKVAETETQPAADAGGESAVQETSTEAEPTAAEQVAALQDRLVRLTADFDNFRKRTVRERSDWMRQAREALLTDLLPVVDHYEMGLKTAADHDCPEALLQGFRMVYEQMQSVLVRAGATAIEAEGQTFDPHVHECISHLPSNDIAADQVIAQVRRGYRLGEYVLRPAQVVVSSGPAVVEGAAQEEAAGED